MQCEGTIHRLFIDRGFGFITTRAKRADIFFNIRDLIGMEWSEDLLQRDVVFRLEETPDGRWRALQIKPARP